MSAGAGDRLARGARSATFGPAQGISQSKWDAMWEGYESPVPIDDRTDEQKEFGKRLREALDPK